MNSIICDFHPESSKPPFAYPDEAYREVWRGLRWSRPMLLRLEGGGWAVGTYAKFDSKPAGIWSESTSGTTLHSVVEWARLP